MSSSVAGWSSRKQQCCPGLAFIAFDFLEVVALRLGKQIVAHLVEQSRGYRKIILYAVPGKEPFYRKFGFLRMKTAMAIFPNQQEQLERGYLSED